MLLGREFSSEGRQWRVLACSLPSQPLPRHTGGHLQPSAGPAPEEPWVRPCCSGRGELDQASGTSREGEGDRHKHRHRRMGMKVDRVVLREGRRRSRRNVERRGRGSGVAEVGKGAEDAGWTWGRPGSRVPAGFERCRPVSLFSWLSIQLFGSCDSQRPCQCSKREMSQHCPAWHPHRRCLP